jgi:hypothetical protein
MKKHEHSLGWCTIELLSKKVKVQRIIIVITALLYVLGAVLYCLGVK